MTKQTRVLAHLQSGKSITPREALDLYGSFRLSAIIFNLRKEHNIKTEIVKHGDYEFAKYSLAPRKDLFS